MRLGHRIARACRKSPSGAVLAAVALVASAYVVAEPFAVSRYPPMTDFPFHAAHASILRHYGDPDWHLREQFILQPLAVPYMSTYAVAALLMLIFPPVLSAKLAALGMLALLPAGLAVMFHGMRKSPFLGLLALPFVWCNLTHWGFVNFVGAIGLFVLSIGLTLRLLDRPSSGVQIGLAATLVAIFFTHIFRFPFAIAGVVGTAVVMAPATRRFRPILLPMVPSLALFALWLVVRPASLSAGMGPLEIHPERFKEFLGYLFGGLNDRRETVAVDRFQRMFAVVFAASAAALLLEKRLIGRSRRTWAWSAGVTLVPLACAAVFLLLFLVLPMEIGIWWYVYPREATAAAFVLLGAAPDLPRNSWLKAPLVLLLAGAGMQMGQVVVESFARFDKVTGDFHRITRQIPLAPKLLYLVSDHSGFSRPNAFLHLPAYVQAERGGWLSFHFAVWGTSPIIYRSPADPKAVVPPPVPLRWEWRPDLFQVKKHGPFFDWFLVRAVRSPDHLFAADTSIRRVDHIGTWWLYRRSSVDRAAAPPPH